MEYGGGWRAVRIVFNRYENLFGRGLPVKMEGMVKMVFFTLKTGPSYHTFSRYVYVDISHCQRTKSIVKRRIN